MTAAAPEIAGVVLAAGRSSRMGRPKALLPVGDRTFLERALETLRAGGCQPLVAVVPRGQEMTAIGTRAADQGATVVENPEPGAEQIDSLRRGLSALSSTVLAAVVLPVDHPKADAATVTALIAAFRARGAPIVRPVHDGTPGHPVLFARETWSELAEPDLMHGAREVVHRHHAEIEDVAVGDAGVTVDVNTPEEYARAVGDR